MTAEEWWDYSQMSQPKAFGDDQTYAKGLGWLDGCGPLVEDWGSGLSFGRQYITRSRYVGIDGSTKNPFADVHADLRTYTSQADGIFIRHVLEHNTEWRRILQNAVDSFRSRLVLVFFTPFGGVTMPQNPSHLTLDISFRKEDITDYLEAFQVKEEHLPTGTQYGSETIFYVERTAP